ARPMFGRLSFLAANAQPIPVANDVLTLPIRCRDIQSSKMVHAALLLLMLGARTTVTPFHHQPEAQHPKSSAIHKNAGRLPHLLAQSGHPDRAKPCPLLGVKRTSAGMGCPLVTQLQDEFARAA